MKLVKVEFGNTVSEEDEVTLEVDTLRSAQLIKAAYAEVKRTAKKQGIALFVSEITMPGLYTYHGQLLEVLMISPDKNPAVYLRTTATPPVVLSWATF